MIGVGEVGALGGGFKGWLVSDGQYGLSQKKVGQCAMVSVSNGWLVWETLDSGKLTTTNCLLWKIIDQL